MSTVSTIPMYPQHLGGIRTIDYSQSKNSKNRLYHIYVSCNCDPASQPLVWTSRMKRHCSCFRPIVFSWHGQRNSMNHQAGLCKNGYLHLIQVCLEHHYSNPHTDRIILAILQYISGILPTSIVFWAAINWNPWFGTFSFPYIGNNNPNWLMFFRGVGQPPTSY